ncbi:hypothetical protein D3C77_516250 [compost metagenome]
MMVRPSGWRISEPSAWLSSNGKAPRMAAMVVIRIGRRRSRQARRIDCSGLNCSWRSSCKARSIIMMAFFFTTPINRNRPSREIRLNSLPTTYRVSKAPTPADGKVERMVSG